MNAERFMERSLTSRANLVWNEGEYVGYRDYYGYKRMLYVLHKLYIEVWYFTSANRIEKVEVFNDTEAIDQYVDLKGILNELKINGKPQ
jgi:hypothetical protein